MEVPGSFLSSGEALLEIALIGDPVITPPWVARDTPKCPASPGSSRQRFSATLPNLPRVTQLGPLEPIYGVGYLPTCPPAYLGKYTYTASDSHNAFFWPRGPLLLQTMSMSLTARQLPVSPNAQSNVRRVGPRENASFFFFSRARKG